MQGHVFDRDLPSVPPQVTLDTFAEVLIGPGETTVLPVFGGGNREIVLVQWDLAQAYHLDESAALAAVISMLAAGMFEYNFGDVEVLRVTLLLSVIPFLTAAASRGTDPAAGIGAAA